MPRIPCHEETQDQIHDQVHDQIHHQTHEQNHPQGRAMPSHTDNPILGEDFYKALRHAAELHASHLRKATQVPYVSHLLSVTALVLEDGGTESEAIAALLHDALEDCADQITADEIEARYGPEVRRLVVECTDTPEAFEGGEKPSWRTRKQAYIDRVASGHWNRVSLADKLHNARSILRDHRKDPAGVWDRFSVTREQTLWYYRELAGAYRKAGAESFLVDELERVVRKLHARDAEVAGG
jgi:(p)ppGpp synthase/HD superfamily hydrolase